jgi:hypothetical protein
MPKSNNIEVTPNDKWFIIPGTEFSKLSHKIFLLLIMWCTINN